MSTNEKIETIRAFVLAARREQGVVNLPGPQLELSCFLHGEFRNLLWRVLFFTPESEWPIYLNDPEIIDGVYREVTWTPTVN